MHPIYDDNALSVGWLSVVDTAVQAQIAPSIVKQVGMPASIEASIFKVIGAEAKTVKVTSSGGIRAGSANLNGSISGISA